MRRTAFALMICLAFASVSYAQDSGQSGAPSEPVKLNANVTPAKLIHYEAPKYPRSAKKAGVSGTVVLKATIGKDGLVRNLEYVSGPEELAGSALKAVKKWKYRTTLIDGKPVEVSTTISVNYAL